MNLIITINQDNEAFDGNRELETARILKDIAKNIQSGHTDFKVQDINGNTVGRVETK